MGKTIRIISLILILTITLNCLISLIVNNKSYAVTSTISTDIENIDDSKYPGIKERIKQLQTQYPNWQFKLLYTNLDWNEVIKNENTGHGISPKNLIYKSSNYQGQWICAMCGDTPYDNGSWRCASEQAIKYMMDPRNSLNSSDVFQFEELSNSGCDINSLSAMTKGTFLEGHEQGIINVANTYNLNGYYLFARLIQEQGRSGSLLTKGEGYNGDYVGYYNAFNIAASGRDTAEVLTNGLAYAKKKDWTTLEKSIEGGITLLATQYVQKGQNTLYLQKFDVESTNGLYSNQYMQNLTAAQTEGETLRKAYVDINTLESSHTFVIPVYENMPKDNCARPDPNIPNSTNEDLVRVNVVGTLRIRNNPNGDKTIGNLYPDEIVARIEKATSKVNGTYWDKIRKSDGLEGYAARETYENEPQYKLYLVPINENNENNTGNNENNNENNNNTSENVAGNPSNVKIDNENKIVFVTPDSIAADICEAYGGSVKITRADKNFLDGRQESVATGYIVADEYIVVKKGDANADGQVNTFDYIRIMNYIMGNKELNDYEKLAADANNDGAPINTFDYIRIMNYIMGNKNIDI